MEKRSVTATRLTLLAGVLALGGLLSAASAAAEDLKLKLTFPTDVATFELPYFVANDTGWYKEHGLEVEELWVVGDANALRTVLADNSDVTVIGLPVVFDALIGGADIVAIGSWQPVVDYQIVGKKGVVGSIEDLPGKTLSSAEPGGLTTELPKMVLQKHGLDPNSVKFIQVGGHGDRLRAVVAGKTQAAMVNTLTATKGKLDGEIDILAALAKDFPGLAYVQSVVKQEDLKDPQLRKALEIFVEGSVYGARFIMDNPDRASEIFHDRIPSMDLELIRSVINELNGIGVWGVNGGAEPEVISYTAKVSTDLGMLKKPIDVEKVLDRSLVEAVLARVGTR